MIAEIGGKKVAETLIMLCIKIHARANEDLISAWTGLPPKIVNHLLNELEKEDYVYHQNLGKLRLWRVSQ